MHAVSIIYVMGVSGIPTPYMVKTNWTDHFHCQAENCFTAQPGELYSQNAARKFRPEKE